MDSWEQRLHYQVERGWKNYHKHRINLSVARADLSVYFAGDFFYVEKTSSASALASVKLNRNTNESLDLQAGSRINTVFTQYFITNTAQSGEWLDVIVGINFEKMDPHPEQSSEAQPAIVITNALADTNTPGAANVCDEVLLRASPDNTGRVWVNFGAVVTGINTCYPLDAGEIIAVRLSNTDQINAWFTVANERLFVIYQV